LEIASGSWVMTDEATPFFPSTVDNIIEGQQFIYNELDVLAQVMWSNDPFGYGPSVPYLFTKTGIHRAVINRDQKLSDTNGTDEMYTHVLPYNHYDILNSCGPDQGVCCQFDFKRITHFSCPGPSPISITKNNVKKKQGRKLFSGDGRRKIQIVKTLLVAYKTKFGTFTDYFNALLQSNEQQNRSLATLSGDFFPYECSIYDYWTGYYTTRPFYKRQERELHFDFLDFQSFIRAADLLSSSAFIHLSTQNRKFIKQNLTDARRNLALFQHHDAITG
uniref:Alpha-mann_mid domain-containing protein n=1 Tax=Gongylonema pulchrum TaxID=637853 RepID=A0A183E2M6_9BILA